ncbi:MAG: flavin reductase family protein [Clostridiales bacterium]|nr:flavin reductase family protein [Clostridiales bacterium]
MKKQEIRAFHYIYPLPAVIVGARAKGKTDYALISNCGVISTEPSVIYISSEGRNYINSLIKKVKVFSVNIPSVPFARAADYCGIASGKKADKTAAFTPFFDGEHPAPMADECPVNLVCRLRKTLKVEGNEVFIASVERAFADSECLTDGKPDIDKVNPLLYDVAKKYRSVGAWAGDALKIGRDFDKDAWENMRKFKRMAREAEKKEKKREKGKRDFF